MTDEERDLLDKIIAAVYPWTDETVTNPLLPFYVGWLIGFAMRRELEKGDVDDR